MREHPGDDPLSSATGKVDVEEDDVGRSLVDHLDGRFDLVRLTDDSDCSPELGPNAGPDNGMVIDEEDARSLLFRAAHAATPRRGMQSSTSAPFPGDDRMATVPPKRPKRARIDWAIPWRSAGTSCGSNPRPRSRT